MTHPDDIDFFYFLENHGWSTCVVFINGKMYEMGPTHIFENPIEILLSSMIDLLNGADSVDFQWQDEPGEYNWSIRRNPEQKHKVQISITGCTQVNTFKDPKIEDLSFEVKLKLFSICVLRQMEKIRDMMQEKSFNENREGDFPYELFKKYKQLHERVYS
ncbi:MULTISPECIES: hypothetical protein [unclassified Pseudoalteromonas]|uniref:hypothetical protein n=1 Tax=unclassified Pseudoalteromonas TaxID=194690 RepID=UPI002098326F|nr:hypothetical protein [Pseudoalteromonas sp. XMcav2-N]MCO7188527.1 hypothetical protein [Pseudoalteromonas sp. XMcav2-N]